MTDLDMMTIKDRQVPIKKLNETQMMLLVREARVLQSSRHDADRKWQGIAFMLDIVESALIGAEDREWLMGLAGAGDISFGDLLRIAAPYENQVNDEVAPNRAVRRARTPRK